MRALTIILLLSTGAVAPSVAAAASLDDFRRAYLQVNLGTDDEGADDEGSDDEGSDDSWVELFDTDPRLNPDVVVSGQTEARLAWQADGPAYEGDPPGSLSVLYDASLPAGLFGFPLPRTYTHADTFTAAAVFLIEADGFQADPNGFFQISWGLWNSDTTGLNRTGSFTEPAADTFDLVEFDYFPNVSPFFGGPFLAPTMFGGANPSASDFPTGGSFANFSSLFGLEVELPLDTPLLAVMEHRPGQDALVLQVHEVRPDGSVLPLIGGVGLTGLDLLSLREYRVDTAGLTLWTDGFGGAFPAVRATLRFQALVVVPGLSPRPEDLLDASGE